MAFLAVLEADLRALSLEARRRHPAVKDAAEHAILKLRSLPDSSLISRSDDIMRIFLMACECKNVKLSVIGLSCLQKLIAHGAVSSSALPEILSTLKEHADVNDESVQLKTLQTILTIFQSHLLPEDEDNMAIALGICFRLLESSRNPDSVHSTAAATLRQAVALIFDRVITAESLPVSNVGSSRRTSRSNSVSGDVSRSIIAARTMEADLCSDMQVTSVAKEQMSPAARIGVRLFEDLTALATGGTASWLRVPFLQRTFALDMIDYVLSNYTAIFRKLGPYQLVLRHQVCSLLMTSLRTTGELEGEAGEPTFRRLVLRSVANVIRLYSPIIVTECEVFLSVLVNSINTELPLWHRIMVLEVLRGFCVEARILRLLFQAFDMRPENTNIVSSMVKSLAKVVTSVQVPDASEESLAAVAGMFSSKAKGVEWSLEHDASGLAVMVASEAHAITLAVEGLLGVVFTVATLTDEAIDKGEVDSPRCGSNLSSEKSKGGELALTCLSMVGAVWQILLEALSLILARSQGEAIVLEILKGYQAFTQACGVLRAVEPLEAFLASLCKFALISPSDYDRNSNSGGGTTASASSGKRGEHVLDQRDILVLTTKNVQALRTIFNIAHRLDCVLGSSWTLVLETLASLDRVIHSPHATTQEISVIVPRLTRESVNQSSDFNILSTLDSQLFESSAQMSTSAVCSLLAALRKVSNESLGGVTSGLGQAVSGNNPTMTTSVGGAMQQMTPKVFAVERMIATLVNNTYRADVLWDQITAHFLELAEHESPIMQAVALDALDRSICTVLGCDFIRKEVTLGIIIENEHAEDSEDVESEQGVESHCSTTGKGEFKQDAFECSVILPLRTLYDFGQSTEVRGGSLKILLHVLERHGEKLYHSWPDILELLRSVANASEREFVPLGFQSVRVIMNDGLLSIPSHALDTCIEVAGAYGAQRTDINISLTAIGLLWTSSDFFARGVNYESIDYRSLRRRFSDIGGQPSPRGQLPSPESNMRSIGSEAFSENNPKALVEGRKDIDSDRLLLAVFGVIQGLGTDDRPEVRNSAIRTLFQSISSHGHKLSVSMWEHCLWNLVFPLLDTVRHLAANSSKDEWQGKELGVHGGKTVHMLVHHSRNTAQKQWDETLVLVLGGMGRLLRPFFHFLQTLTNLKKGWSSLLQFTQESILKGSKEVATAAINSLHSVLIMHSSKGTLPDEYFDTAFGVYAASIQGMVQCHSKAASKVQQELIRNLGELYAVAHRMFKPDMYLRALALVDLVARYSSDDSTVPVQGTLPQVQRSVLEVLPAMKPHNEELVSLWPVFLRQVVAYLNPEDTSHWGDGKCFDQVAVAHLSEHLEGLEITRKSQTNHPDGNGLDPALPPEHQKNANISDISREIYLATFPLFAERTISILLDVYYLAPVNAREEVLPDLISSLGRCMVTRRDDPGNSLWRSAVTAFNHILLKECPVSHSTEEHSLKCGGSGRSRFWRELADVYENFLVGTCGRAFILSACDLSPEAIRADESLEATVLDVLCNSVLKCCADAPFEVIERFIDMLDRCASRTSTLPLDTVVLLPTHCSHFSLVCLQMLFTLSRYYPESVNGMSQLTVSKVALPVLLRRCNSVLCQFSKDENEHGEINLPSVRVDEVVFVLQELARLVLHPTYASEFKSELVKCFSLPNFQHFGERAHLAVIFGSLTELVLSRETRVRELLLVLLRLLGCELGFIQSFGS